jgi:hypothetical protein
MFSFLKKPHLYSVVWRKQFANGTAVDHAVYTVAKSEKEALKNARTRFSIRAEDIDVVAPLGLVSAASTNTVAA